MANHATILGGSGQIGLAAARHFIASGWRVQLVARSFRPHMTDLVNLGADFIAADRYDGASLKAALRGGDLLIDTIAYDSADAETALRHQTDYGHIVAISSASVYCDAKGRTLDEAAQNGFPEFPAPIDETQRTVPPGPATYSTRKVAMEQTLMGGASTPVTILRPCAIHGVHSRHPREWWLIKRMRDHRAVVPLAYGGRSRFHTTSVQNIAQAALRAVGSAGGIVNVGDHKPPDLFTIANVLAQHCGYDGEIRAVETEGREPNDCLGRTPWSVPSPFIIDISRFETMLGHAAYTYAHTVGAVCDWLMHVDMASWETHFPIFTTYKTPPFDYAAEDAALAR